MKKAIYLGIAALLALAVFSCNDISDPADDNTGGITLGVKDSAGRALAGYTAEPGTNFYEAAFQRNSTGPIIRTTWNYARKGKIQIEPGVYKVIIMAGRNADKTLLGVGAPTDVREKGDPSGSLGSGTFDSDALTVTITTSTTDIIFTVFPLVNNITGEGINASGSTDASTTSTFKTELQDGTESYPLPSAKDEIGNTIPIFIIHKSSPAAVATTATWRFGIRELLIPDAGAPPANISTPEDGDLIDIFKAYIHIASATSNVAPQLFQTGFSAVDSYDIPQLLEDKDWVSGVNAGDPISGTFEITVTAPVEGDGIVQLALAVPVVAFSDDVGDNPVIWYIRGGLNNGSLDAGIGNNGAGGGLQAKPGMLGGAILLGFGNLSAFPIVTLTPGWN